MNHGLLQCIKIIAPLILSRHSGTILNSPNCSKLKQNHNLIKLRVCELCFIVYTESKIVYTESEALKCKNKAEVFMPKDFAFVFDKTQTECSN